MADSLNERAEERKTYFARTNHRGKEQIFGVKAKDRLKHVYVIGKTGMGKSVLLENMAIQDIRNGNGLAFLDPHGASAETLLEHIPEERIQDVVYLAPFDMDFPISFNVMEDVGYDKRHLVVSNLMSAFKKIWPDVWSSRMEYILQNALLALLEYPDSTLLSINRMLIDKDFRKDVIAHISDPIVKSFWADEFAKYTDRYTQEATPAIQNKVGQFIANPVIRNIVGQAKSSFDPRELMDNRKILILNLSKGRMGDTNSRLLGSMLIIKVYLSAMSRAEASAGELAALPPFYFYVDEFQSFANETFADILSEARKYKLSLTIAHQYVGQMPEEVKDAIFGNVGTILTFRIGAEDAEMLEKEFAPTFTAEDMVNLGAYTIYLKLMIDGLTSAPFSAVTLAPLEKPERSFASSVITHARETYAKPRGEVETAIRKRQEPVAVLPKEEKKREKTHMFSRETRKTAEGQRGLGRRESPRARGGISRAASGNRRQEKEKHERPAPPLGHGTLKDALYAAARHREKEAGERAPAVREKKATMPPHSLQQKESEKRNQEHHEPVSLNVLRKNNKAVTGKTRENLSALQQALETVLKDEGETPPSPQTDDMRQRQREAGTVPGDETRENTAQNKKAAYRRDVRQRDGKDKQLPDEVPEIPEQELREMLKTEK